MKIFLHNRRDIKVFQNGMPLKVYYSGGNEYVVPEIDSNGYFQVQFVKKSEFSGALWWLKAILFWVIGIMGIFTPKYAKCNHSLDCKVVGMASQDSLNVSFVHPNPKYGAGVGVKVREEVVAIDGAEYIADSKASKRKKLYSFLSAIARLAVIAIVVVVIIKSIIG